MEVEKDSAGLMSPPLAGGRDSEREVILPQGPSLDERYSGCGMDSACLGPDDCAAQAVIDREHQSLIIGNQRLPPKERCNRKTSSIALMGLAGAWSKSKTSFAVQHAPMRRMQFLAPVPAGIPNVLEPKKERTKPSWNCQRKRPSKFPN